MQIRLAYETKELNVSQTYRHRILSSVQCYSSCSVVVSIQHL